MSSTTPEPILPQGSSPSVEKMYFDSSAPGELEEQCLKEDHRYDDLKYPACDVLTFGKRHFVLPLYSNYRTSRHTSRISHINFNVREYYLSGSG